MCLRKPSISCITTYNFLITNIKQKPVLRGHFKVQILPKKPLNEFKLGEIGTDENFGDR
jgi:hypothetical protein